MGGPVHDPSMRYMRYIQTMPAIQNLPHQLATEADARFWQLTGYKPGHRLLASNPADLRMMPVWVDVYRQVLAEHLPKPPQAQQQLLAPPTLPAPPVLQEALPVAAPMPPVEDEERGRVSMSPLIFVGGLLVAGVLAKLVHREVHLYRDVATFEGHLVQKARAAK